MATRAATRRYADAQLRDFVRQVRTDGFCLLKGHFPPALIERWRVAFAALLEERIRAGTASARGPGRYYVSLPFEQPWADPAVYEDPDILAIVEELAGEEIVMPELATDTPLKGSDYQLVHRDHKRLSPQMPDADPARPFQFAVNFALVPVRAENGPLEIARGTHLWTDEQAQEAVRSGSILERLEPIYSEPGDVMVRDVRALHRGTPNRTDEPRPVVVVGYNCARHLRPQLRVFIPTAALPGLSERARRLLRPNPVVEKLDESTRREAYSNLYFLEPDEQK